MKYSARLLLLCSFCIILSSFLCSQNLIRNPSFEKFSNCPSKVYEIKYCNYWWKPPLTNSPDYFNNCSIDTSIKSVVHTPNNFVGFQEPKDGTAYLGIICFSGSNFSYQEYIQSELLQELTKDREYEFTIYISLADSSKYYSNVIQFCFSNSDKLKTKNYKGYYVLECNTCLAEDSLQILSNNVDWNEIKIRFTAKGGEKYLTIGVFKDQVNRKINKKRKKENIIKDDSTKDFAYYYLDKLSLIEVIKP